HDDQVGAGRAPGGKPEVLYRRDQVEGVIGSEIGVGRQHVDLTLEVEQAGQVAYGHRHWLPGGRIGRRHGDGQPVGEHDRQPSVVVAVGQLGVADVDLAHVDE